MDGISRLAICVVSVVAILFLVTMLAAPGLRYLATEATGEMSFIDRVVWAGGLWLMVVICIAISAWPILTDIPSGDEGKVRKIKLIRR